MESLIEINKTEISKTGIYRTLIHRDKIIIVIIPFVFYTQELIKTVRFRTPIKSSMRDRQRE